MTIGPRFDIRPQQRGRDGLPALAASNPPRIEDVMIDRIKIRVSGSFGHASSADDAGALFDRYKLILMERASDAASNWNAPTGRSKSTSRIGLRSNNHSTIRDASITIKWAREATKFGLNVTVNPTRTLVHRLSEIEQTDDPIGTLATLTPSDFFAASRSLQQLQTLDGNDNAISDWSSAQSLLGEDFSMQFMRVFAEQLRRWAIEAVAPRSLGFTSQSQRAGILATSGNDYLQLFWHDLTVLSAEVYFERRHSQAVDLLNRLTRDIPAGHLASRWRRYGQNETGERRLGAEVIGLDITKTIQQKYYAKTNDRVRIETTYTSAIRNALRQRLNDPTQIGLFELCHALCLDTIARCQWEEFCDLCGEPMRATLQEAAQLFAIVSVTAHNMGVDPTHVLSALLSTGGIDATVNDEPDLPMLLEKLESDGILRRRNLRRRRQPNDPIRYRLNSDWMDVADRIQRAFPTESIT